MYSDEICAGQVGMGWSPSRFMLTLTRKAGSGVRVGLYPQAGQSPNTTSSLCIQTGSVPCGPVLVTWRKQINAESRINNSFLLQVLSSAMPFQTRGTQYPQVKAFPNRQKKRKVTGKRITLFLSPSFLCPSPSFDKEKTKSSSRLTGTN